MLIKEMEFVLLDFFCKVLHREMKKVNLLRVLVLKNNAQKHSDILWDYLYSKQSKYLNSMNLCL